MNKAEQFLREKGIKSINELEDANDLVQYNAFVLQDIKAEQKDLQEKGASKEELAELEARLNSKTQEQIETLLKSVQSNQELVKELSKKQTVEFEVLSPFEKSIDDNLENIKKGASMPHSTKREFSVKTNFTATSVTNNTDSLRLPNIGQLAHRALSVWDSLPKLPVSPNQNGTVRYTDWDEATKVRAAAMVAEGGVFPESTAAFEEYSISLRKVGDTIPITEESLYDRARFTAELRMFLETNVNLITDQQVYSGDGTGNNMTGFNTTAIAYTPVASGISNPSLYDLLVKVKESMTAGKDSKYMPNVVYMNISDINRMKLEKDANFNYVAPPFASSGGGFFTVDGMIVVESNVVTSNTFTIADNRFIRVYEEPGMAVSTGLVGDQFKQDLITLKARRRANVLVRESDKQGVYKVTDIDAALVTLAL